VQIPGSGLMADPTNIANQMKFAQGLIALPGGQKALQSFAPMLQQAIQSKQWQQGQQQQQRQFETTDSRLTDQFDQTKTWQQQEADRAQANWKAQFEQTARQQAQQLHMEGARLSLAQQSAAREAKESAWRMAGGATGGEKIPSGYGVVDTASGKSLAPLRGTKDFATATAAEGTLTSTIGTIDALMDEYLGKEETTAGGNTRRVGGYGSEWDLPFSNKAPLTSMNNKRGSIIAALGTAREMGVLDKNEYERLTKQLPEVNDLRSKPEAFEAAYKGIRGEFQRKLETHRKANPWLVPPPPPGYH
jgi:exonuclease VII large subunit